MSSTILYLAIVAIWAGVLVPRWLRREPHHQSAAPGVEWAAPDSDQTRPGAGQAGSGADRTEPDRQEMATQRDTGEDAAVKKNAGSRRRRPALAARRRLFGILAALAVAAAMIAGAGLAGWWVMIPPGVMFAGYLALLREAARVDAERSRRGASARTRRGAAPRAARTIPGATDSPADAPRETHAAEVVDIRTKMDGELYDQYADAKLRAVGD